MTGGPGVVGSPPGGRHAEPGEQGLRVALGGGSSSRLFLALHLGGGREAEHAGAEELDGVLEVGHAGGFKAVVSASDELLDGGFVLLEVGVEVGLVEVTGALGLGQDEVQQEAETQVRVEGDPHEHEADPGLDEEHARQDRPVHEPWRQLGGVGGLERLVRGEEGEEERGDRAMVRGERANETYELVRATAIR